MKIASLALATLIGLSVAGCADTHQDRGTAIGALAGGLIGSQFGGGTGERIAAGLAGAAIGGLIGNAVGQSMDEEDRRRAYEAEAVALNSGRRQDWRGGRAYGYVEPGAYYARGPVRCREYSHTVYIDGRPQTMVGRACPNGDGTWRQAG